MEFLSLSQNLKVLSDSSQDHLSSLLIHIPGISHCFSTTRPLLGVMGISGRWTENTQRCKVESGFLCLGEFLMSRASAPFCPRARGLHRAAGGTVRVPGTGGLLVHPRCQVRMRPLGLWKGRPGAVLV